MKLIRDDQTTERTLGTLTEDDGTKICETIELPWKDNARSISCIPAGTYPVNYRWSQSHGRDIWHIDGVPNRDNVEIHIANTVRDLKGCVGVGKARALFTMPDGARLDGVTQSHAAFDAFMARDPLYRPFVLVVFVLVVTDP